MTEIPANAQAFAADWSGADEIPAEVVNQVLTQLGLPVGAGPDQKPEGLYLTFGAASPPVIFGDEQMMRRQLASYDGRLRIRPVARLFLTRERVEELVGVLQTALSNFDAVGEEANHA